jgi:LysW-gamma-L-lysine carboxypeptidase
VYYGSMAARLLYRLVSVYSPTFHEAEASRVLLEEASAMGFDLAYIDPVGNVRLVKLPPGGGEPGERIALVSHIDTVPGWVEALMPGGSLVRGRGAVDAKAPLSAMVVAASLYEPRSRVVEVVAAVGGEGPSHGAWYLVEQEHWRAHATIIGEPTNTTKVAIGYRGGCRIRVTCLGEPGHSSSPWLYQSACGLAVRAYHIAEELSSPGVQGYTLTVTGMNCGSGGNIVAEEAELVIDARIPVGGSADELLAKLQEALPPSCAAERASERCLPPVRVPVSSPAPRALIRGLLRQGRRAQPVIKAGTSDMNILYRVSGSIAAYGPGKSELSHTRYEETTIEELDTAVRTYLEALRELDR